MREKDSNNTALQKKQGVINNCDTPATLGRCFVDTHLAHARASKLIGDNASRTLRKTNGENLGKLNTTRYGSATYIPSRGLPIVDR